MKTIQDIISGGDVAIAIAIRETVNAILAAAKLEAGYTEDFEAWLYATHGDGDGHRLAKGFGYDSNETRVKSSFFEVVRTDYAVTYNDEPTGINFFEIAITSVQTL